MKTLHLNWFPFIYTKKQDKKSNKNVYKYSQNELYITINVSWPSSKGETRTPFKCATGPFVQMYNWDRNLTEFIRPLEVQAEGTSNHVRLYKIVVWTIDNQKMSQTYHEYVLIVYNMIFWKALNCISDISIAVVSRIGPIRNFRLSSGIKPNYRYVSTMYEKAAFYYPELV